MKTSAQQERFNWLWKKHYGSTDPCINSQMLFHTTEIRKFMLSTRFTRANMLLEPRNPFCVSWEKFWQWVQGYCWYRNQRQSVHFQVDLHYQFIFTLKARHKKTLKISNIYYSSIPHKIYLVKGYDLQNRKCSIMHFYVLLHEI